MKKNNEKGFILAEAIVVGVFILSLFTFLFMNIIPLIGKYEAVEKYDTIDSVYNTNMIRMLILENSNSTSFFPSASEEYIKYTKNTFCDQLNNTGNEIHSTELCNKLLSKTYLDVNTIFITKFRLSNLKHVVKTSTDFTRAEREYILSLDNFTQPTNAAFNNYHRIIVEYNDGSFANLEIKK